MATKRRRPAKRTTAAKRTSGRRRHQAPRSRASAGARSGTREARREEVARLVETAPGPRLVSAEGTGRDRAAEATSIGEAGVPGFARLAVQAADAEAHSRRWATGGETDSDAETRRRGDFGRGRPAEEAASTAWIDDRDLPGLSEIGLELALGALRLIRTIVTAPLRIGLAFLRPREA